MKGSENINNNLYKHKGEGEGSMFEVSLKGQVCLITGATRGIGKAVALTMAKADLMGLVIVDIQKDAVAEETQKELKKALIDDNSSFTDFFNEAAIAYLNNPQLYKQKNSVLLKNEKNNQVYNNG